MKWLEISHKTSQHLKINYLIVTTYHLLHGLDHLLWDEHKQQHALIFCLTHQATTIHIRKSRDKDQIWITSTKQTLEYNKADT